MNKKVRQLSTDNKMASVHQQDDDPEKIIDLGTRIPVLRTPIASDVLTEVAHSLPEPYAQTLQEALARQGKISQRNVFVAPALLRHTRPSLSTSDRLLCCCPDLVPLPTNG